VIRITVQPPATAPVVVIDGWLVEGDLDEVARTRQRLSGGVALRLGGLESCDAAGQRFLQDWLQAGAALETASPFLRAVLTGTASERSAQGSPARPSTQATLLRV
jgi:hypothetical protein